MAKITKDERRTLFREFSNLFGIEKMTTKEISFLMKIVKMFGLEATIEGLKKSANKADLERDGILPYTLAICKNTDRDRHPIELSEKDREKLDELFNVKV